MVNQFFLMHAFHTSICPPRMTPKRLLHALLLAAVAVAALENHDIPDVDFADFDRYYEEGDDDFGNEDFSLNEQDRKKSLEDAAERDFKEFDVNQDGELDAQEVWAKFGGYLNAIDLFYFFTQANKRSTGTVNYKEYLEYIIQTTKQEGTKESNSV